MEKNMTDIYKQLAEFFDSFPQRFPKDSQQGQNVLKMMISPEEARLFTPEPDYISSIMKVYEERK
jgi:hypothetical protein